MVRSEIISKLSDKIHRKIKKQELEKILNILIETIVEGVRDHKSIELRNFGRFSLKKIKEKMNARNPRTGQKIHTPARKSISFKILDSINCLLILSLKSSNDLCLIISLSLEESSSVAYFDLPILPPEFKIGPIK